MIIHWVAFCVALHLNGNMTQAWQAVESINVLIKNDKTNNLKPVEENEFKLYQVKLLIELNEYEKAIEILSQKDSITDVTSQNEFYVEIYKRQSKLELALSHALKLIELQDKNWRYYRLFFELHNIPEKNLSSDEKLRMI